MKFPNLLIVEQLVKPIEIALNRLKEIRTRKINSDDSIIREGLFVLSVSTFENALLDSLRIFLKGFPQKLGRSHSVSKNSLIANTALIDVIESTINKLAYKDIEYIFKELQSFFDIEGIAVSQNEIDTIIEFKASRNLLIHNNLVINDIYRNTAGSAIRTGYSNKLEISDDYLADCITTQTNILNNLNESLRSKYINYTRINALKELWKFTFGDSSVVAFDEEWEVDEDRDSISSYNSQSSNKNMLSSGERALFDLWLLNTIGDNPYSDSLNFHRLDSSNLEIASFLIKNLEYFEN